MLLLSKAAVDYAVEECRIRDEYSVVIVILSRTVLEDTLNNLKHTRDKYDDVRIDKRMNGGIVYFNNGSRIRIIPASNNTRGLIAHLLIIDEDIDYELVRSVFYPIERLEQQRLYRKWINRDLQEITYDEDTECDMGEKVEDVIEKDFLKVIGV